jgi:hypothetical protein
MKEERRKEENNKKQRKKKKKKRRKSCCPTIQLKKTAPPTNTTKQRKKETQNGKAKRSGRKMKMASQRTTNLVLLAIFFTFLFFFYNSFFEHLPKYVEVDPIKHVLPTEERELELPVHNVLYSGYPDNLPMKGEQVPPKLFKTAIKLLDDYLELHRRIMDPSDNSVEKKFLIFPPCSWGLGNFQLMVVDALIIALMTKYDMNKKRNTATQQHAFFLKFQFTFSHRHQKKFSLFFFCFLSRALVIHDGRYTQFWRFPSEEFLLSEQELFLRFGDNSSMVTTLTSSDWDTCKDWEDNLKTKYAVLPIKWFGGTVVSSSRSPPFFFFCCCCP